MAFSNYLSNISPQYTGAQQHQAAQPATQQIPAHAAQQNQQLYAAYAYQQQMLMQQQQQQPQAAHGVVKVPYQVAAGQIPSAQVQGLYGVATQPGQVADVQAQQVAYQAYANPTVQAYTTAQAGVEAPGVTATEAEKVGWDSVEVNEYKEEANLGKRARPEDSGNDGLAEVAERALKVRKIFQNILQISYRLFIHSSRN